MHALANMVSPPFAISLRPWWTVLVEAVHGVAIIRREVYRPERHYMRGFGPKSRAKLMQATQRPLAR